ncbi:PREDICTED: proline--tRNA ligase, cytoplasmic-like [Camelina sativa]|uniref:proline--tRNA ligase n=1 Tax=Camelina sativa TaxID=90675 RepID=A0ABM0UPW5_CAMSA|nr:PREDICTED: proline--tRNA ligase, cytoplasmic-like [Camelina sativa]
MVKSVEVDLGTSTSLGSDTKIIISDEDSVQVETNQLLTGEASVVNSSGKKKKETRLGISVKKDEDFGNWYSEVCRFGELLEYYEQVKGCYILKPSAMKIWNVIRRFFDAEIEKMDVEEYYFPMFVSRGALEKEKDHIKGFAPEVAWVTRAGESDLETPIALRPTSETVIYPYLSKWIRGHRDLPLKINQWNNVVRWESSDTTPFVRSREFLWQEGHTAFATKEEAEQEVLDVLNIYSRVYEELLAVPVIKGIKSENEKFAGAFETKSIEAFIPSTGRGIQAATSHCLGQNFAQMFDITFEDKKGKRSMVWQNSWGLSTRSIGVMVMTHGDDKGVVFPPKVAPVKVVVIQVPIKGAVDDQVLCDACEAVVSTLHEAGIRAKSDTRDNYSCGWKYADQELKGAPLRIEIGPRDLANDQVRIVRRDTGAKMDVKRGDLIEQVKDLLEKIQRNLYDVAKRKLEECTQKVETWEEFEEALRQKKLILAPWCDEVEVEKDVRKRSGSDETGGGGAKTLCTPLEQPELREDTLCFASGKPAKKWSYWGRSY